MIRADLSPMTDTPSYDSHDTAGTVGDWLNAITGEFGLDPEPYADVNAHLDDCARLDAWAAKWRTTATLDERAAARLVADATSYDDAAATVSASVRATNDTEREAGQRILTRAHGIAATRALTALRALADHTFTGLQTLYADSVTATLTAADTINASRHKVTNLESASRAGVADAWVTLETEHARRQRVAEFVRYATGWRVLPHAGQHKHTTYGVRRWYTRPQLAEDMGTFPHLYDVGGLLFDALKQRKAGGALRHTHEADTTPVIDRAGDLAPGRPLWKKYQAGELTAADVEALSQ